MRPEKRLKGPKTWTLEMIDLRPNCVAQFKMNDDAASPWVAGLNGIPTELVQNNLFNVEAGWTYSSENWSYLGDPHYCAECVGSDWLLQTSPSGFVEGNKYLIIFSIPTSAPAGVDCIPYIGGDAGTKVTAEGRYSEVIICGNEPESGIWFKGTANCGFTLDNVFCICLDDFPCTGVLFDSSNNFTSDHSVAGKVNKALHFDGNTHVKVFDEGALNFGADESFTICFLFRSSTITAGERIFHKRLGLRGYEIYKSDLGDGKLYTFYGDGTNYKYYPPVINTNVCDGVWHFICIVFDTVNDEIRGYLDGSYSNTLVISAVTGDISPGGDALIAAFSTTHNLLNGDIDVLAFYDKILSQAEKDWIWKDGECTERLNQIAFYKSVERGILSGVNRGVM